MQHPSQHPSQHPPQYPQGPYPYPAGQGPKPSGGTSGWIIGVVIALFGIVFVVGILAVLAISGTRKYIANAKQAEAKNSLGQIARDAVAAYEAEDPMGDPLATNKLCKSAVHAVPRSVSDVSGKKYMSTSSEWTSDPKGAGFTCLHFEMSMPQYYSYDYKATATSFKGLAAGDLDGDGTASHFEIEGRVQPSGVLTIAPSIVEIDADE
jgi:type IV pilus assembly protein PilA